jgi:hypothetical protein
MHREWRIVAKPVMNGAMGPHYAVAMRFPGIDLESLWRQA